MVFYRKYRPQTIDQLDIKEVRDTLTSILSLPEPPHAFLFTGPKGLGKTSTARIVAKVVNCERTAMGIERGAKSLGQKKKKDREDAKSVEHVVKGEEKAEKTTLSSKPLDLSLNIEPCNECEQCISITNGTNLDILEIDAASNRGIDEIRDLRDKIRLAPVAARKKIYIIDEVHMLTTEAFNALLKTLEEPPAHAIFILCTTELHKVPETIISRCFQIQFHPATKEEIKRSFKRIAEGENFTVDDEAIEAIVTLADGGFRDATKILEELVSTGEKKISLDLVEKRYKVSSIKYKVSGMIIALEKRDTKEGLSIVKGMVEEGIDMKQFMMQLLDALHGLLLEKVGIGQVNSEITIQRSVGEAGNLKLEIAEIRSLLMLLSEAIIDMKYAVLPQLPLELAIIEWAESAKGIELSAKNEEVVVEQSVTKVRLPQTGVTVAGMRKQLGDLARVKALYGEEKKAPIKADEEVRPSVNLLNVSNTEITPEWLQSFWTSIISEMKQYNHTIAGVLRGCMIQQFDKKNLIIETAYKFHKERLDDLKTRETLEQVCKTLTGNSVRVEVVLKG